MSKTVRLKNGQEVDRCQECKRDWDIVKHSSGGLCRGCHRMKQHKEAKLPQKWSAKFDCCQNKECPNTKDRITSRPHNAEGLCCSCYSTKQRYEDIEHSHHIEAARRVQPGFAEKQAAFYADWYNRNRKEQIKKSGEYQKEHPEETRAWCAKYRDANREICRASYKKWRDNHPEEAAERGRLNRQDNPELYRQHNRNRRARLEEAEGSFTTEEWFQVCEEHEFQCYHCHKEQSDDIPLTPDHLVPIIKGGSNYITNIAPLCGSCNSSKCGKDLIEFDPEYYNVRFGK